MARNINAPRGIIADGVGFPLRESWQRPSLSNEGKALLPTYSDEQLITVSGNAQKSKRRWNMARKTGQLAQFVPGMAAILAITDSFVQPLQHTPVDAIARLVGTALTIDENISLHFPTVGVQAGVFLTLAFFDFIGIAVAKEVAADMERKRESQLKMLSMEQMNRSIQKAQEAAQTPQA